VIQGARSPIFKVFLKEKTMSGKRGLAIERSTFVIDDKWIKYPP